MSSERVCVGRRAILECGIGVGLGICLAPVRLFGQSDGASSLPKTGDFFVKAGAATPQPLTAGDIAANEPPTMAWAIDPVDKTIRNASRLNAVLLVRIDPSLLAASSRSRAVDGIVAYTAICTHSGCEVSDWIPENLTMSCPCHDSRFDPKDEGKVVDGPAPRPLPALPLKIVDGKLAVAGPFTSRVGFEGAP
jgi:rieske iron-sulfur protein